MGLGEIHLIEFLEIAELYPETLLNDGVDTKKVWKKVGERLNSLNFDQQHAPEWKVEINRWISNMRKKFRKRDELNEIETKLHQLMMHHGIIPKEIMEKKKSKQNDKQKGESLGCELTKQGIKRKQNENSKSTTSGTEQKKLKQTSGATKLPTIFHQVKNEIERLDKNVGIALFLNNLKMSEAQKKSI